ncbi:ABC transporter substrate-binding protein [Occultella glacieicola]|uniref:ABC transporter substrate-binding protein n=1 Tax=Occultella glacieicola TaxID=2518684 RepID=A0ABY2E3N7_9MICO|nr:ABC transporter substrate-binding protein [Occultella glacieicola]TDE92731.1 ABC transporter substrate-binding protein [Occultella glacieicola]
MSIRTVRKGRLATGAFAVGAVLALAACGSGDPLAPEDTGSESGDGGAATGPIVIGSQAYYSNEIIAEIYAQALEADGFEVERQFQIGQRDVYMAAMEDGSVQLIPEYSGNLLQFYDAETEARSTEDVAAALPDAVPDGLAVLDPADAQDADSYNVTAAFSEENGITSLADLADFDGTLTVGGNAELESRPYGPPGLSEFYGVDVEFVAIGDSGGPLTKDAIRDGTITMGDIYTADPDLATGDFVTLEDPESMILAQNVTPVVAADLAEAVTPTLDAVNALLTTEELIALNASSVNDQQDSATIATAWLTDNGLL